MKRSILLLAALAALVFTAIAVAAQPVATTRPPTGVTQSSATLTGTVDPNKQATTYFFQYGSSAFYGTRTATQGPINGNKAKNATAPVAGLAANTTYHYRLVAVNPSGTSFGADVAFKTLAAGVPLPGANGLSILATPNPVLHGRATTISGQLSGANHAGVQLTLAQNPFPYTGGFKAVATTTTNASGGYAFIRAPKYNLRYRVTGNVRRRGRVTSAELTVRVRTRITLAVSDRTPARGQLVRFSGSAFPPHNGRLLLIQRRIGTGSYVTIARTRLQPFSAIRSTFRRSLRIFRSGSYRAVVLGHSDHAFGASSRRVIVVH